MSCREPAGGKAASAAATAITGISANDTPEVMHRIRREFRQAGHTRPATQQEIIISMSQLARQVRLHPGISDARRARVLEKIETAVTVATNNTETPPDLATVLTWQHLISRIETERALEAAIADARNAHHPLTIYVDEPYGDEEDEEEEEGYDEGMFAGYDDASHEESLAAVRRIIEATRAAQQPPQPPTPFVPAFPQSVEPWDMDAFQKEWDTARTRIRNGETRIPRRPDLEAIPGAITGGLGSRDGGNSFGIELEIDFPDDDYPFNTREEFAQELYRRGIARSPQVEPWHFVGDGRSGGTFIESSANWVCEFDRSVDPYEGARGCEIKSQILYDEPDTWKNINEICEVAESLGAKVTHRTGLHINVGGAKFDPTNVEDHNNLLRLAAAYDDTMLRIAHNPEAGDRHRGRDFCHYVQLPPDGFSDTYRARYHSGHYQAFNLGHLPGPGEPTINSSRVEHRIWDSTLDPGRIQAAVTVSLAMVAHAHNKTTPGQPAEPAGRHRETYGRRRLEGDEWEASTESFRRLTSLIGVATKESPHIKTALTTMFANTVWQRDRSD